MEIHSCAELEALAGMLLSGTVPGMVFQTSHPIPSGISCSLLGLFPATCHMPWKGDGALGWSIRTALTSGSKKERERMELRHAVRLGLSIPLAHQLETLQLNELPINAPAFLI